MIEKASRFRTAIGAYNASRYELAYNILMALAEEGYAPAEHRIGDFYKHGIPPVKEDHYQALYWYERAAEQGLAWAQTDLGDLYSVGQRVSADPDKAVSWWREAANRGHAPAALRMGLSFLHGRGVRPNLELAVYWLEIAADSGDPKARQVLSSLRAKTEEGATGMSAPGATEHVKPVTPEKPAPSATLTSTADLADNAPIDSTTAEGGTFSIWLASEGGRQAAEAFLRRARESYPEYFSSANGLVQEAEVGQFGTYFRILFGEWPDYEAAEGVCHGIRSRQPAAFCKILEN